jgi:hypothetical protein
MRCRKEQFFAEVLQPAALGCDTLLRLAHMVGFDWSAVGPPALLLAAQEHCSELSPEDDEFLTGGLVHMVRVFDSYVQSALALPSLAPLVRSRVLGQARTAKHLLDCYPAGIADAARSYIAGALL